MKKALAGIGKAITKMLRAIAKGMQTGLAAIFGGGGGIPALDEADDMAEGMEAGAEVNPAMAKTQALRNELEKKMDAHKVLDYLKSPTKDAAIAAEIKNESVRRWATRLSGKSPELVAGATPEMVFQHITGRSILKGVPTVAELNKMGPQPAFGRKVATEISRELKAQGVSQAHKPAEVISLNAARSAQNIDGEARFNLMRARVRQGGMAMSQTAKAGGMGMSAGFQMKPNYANG